MNIKDQFGVILTGLAEFGTRFKCPVTVAHDQTHLVQIMTGAAGAARIGILVLRETPRNETYADVVGLLDRKFWICISRGYLLESFPGKALTEGYAGGPALYDLVDDLVCAVRALRFDAPEPVPYYLGFEQLTIADVKLDAYALTIQIASDRGNQPIDTAVSNEG